MSWRELRFAAQANAAPNVPTILPLSVALDLSNLKAGSYWVELSARSRTRNTATSRRQITIR